jgi:uncharacterized protein YndB with AHSA1/START domain
VSWLELVSNRWTVAALVLIALPAFAERPPARDHAATEITEFKETDAGVEAQTPGVRFLATLSPSERAAFAKEGLAVLDGKSGSSSGKTGSEAAALLRAVIRLDRPRAEVFAIITQPSTLVTYMPHVTQSKTVGERTAEGEVIDMVVSFIFTFRYRTQHWFYPEEHRMEWNLDPSGEDGLTEQLGFFQLYALDEKTTIAEFGTKVVARDGLLNFFRSIGERGGLISMLTEIRKHVATAKP